ncbi:MAG: hypothetical protein A2148_09465 [Chloroflexi bacterium RBG_16_68_14]|nr:MAG: hypothetical protein A2148_09465 [Chloroflexi bacterium RBG_16_68_14]
MAHPLRVVAEGALTGGAAVADSLGLADLGVDGRLGDGLMALQERTPSPAAGPGAVNGLGLDQGDEES